MRAVTLSFFSLSFNPTSSSLNPQQCFRQSGPLQGTEVQGGDLLPSGDYNTPLRSDFASKISTCNQRDWMSPLCCKGKRMMGKITSPTHVSLATQVHSSLGSREQGVFAGCPLIILWLTHLPFPQSHSDFP